MITRMVRMVFREDAVKEFLTLFRQQQASIRAFEGCQYPELLQDTTQQTVFFTHSRWESEIHLENYRRSGLFKDTWAATKKLFADKPAAWSLKSVAKI
jgi:quinol monooxygenase YgiN